MGASDYQLGEVNEDDNDESIEDKLGELPEVSKAFDQLQLNISNHFSYSLKVNTKNNYTFSASPKMYTYTFISHTTVRKNKKVKPKK